MSADFYRCSPREVADVMPRDATPELDSNRLAIAVISVPIHHRNVYCQTVEYLA